MEPEFAVSWSRKLRKNIKILHIVDFTNKNKWFEEYLLLFAQSGMEQEIVNINVNSELSNHAENQGIPMTSSYKYLAHALQRKLRRKDPDFILAHGYKPSILASVLRISGGPKFLIVHHHQPNFFKFYKLHSHIKSFVHSTLLQMTYRLCFAIQSFSLEVTNALHSKKISSTKIFENPIGMDLALLTNINQNPDLLREKVQSDLTIVSIGRLSWEKNYELAIQAISLLIRSGLKVNYDIYGDGPDKQVLKCLVSKLDADDFIFFKGFDSDVLTKINSYDLFLHASLTESYGQVIFEAYFLDVSILTSNVGVGLDLHELDGKNVHLFKENSPKAIADQIKAIVFEKSFLATTKKIDREVLSEHSLEKSVANLVDFLRTSFESSLK